MAVSVGNLAPRAVVVGLVAFGVWPTLTQFFSEERSKPPEPLPELAAALLSPKPPPLPTRDPFGLATPGKPAPLKNLAAKQDARSGPLALAALASSKKTGASDRAGGKPVDPLVGFALTGTCIMGDQRLAVINGRLYAPQEILAIDKPATSKPSASKPAASKPIVNNSLASKLVVEPSPASPYQIIDVLPYKVLLAHDGEVLELVYSNVTSGPASKARADGKAGAGGARKSRGSADKARSKKTGK